MRLLLLALGLVVSHGAEPLKWEACVEAARKNNPELQAAGESLRSAEWANRGAHGGFFPQVSGTLAYEQGPVVAGGASQTTYTASITAKQNLFAGFADAAAVRKASAQLELARATANQVQSRVSYDLKSAFAGVNFAEATYLLFTDIVSRREANLKLVELRYQSGRENKGSLLLSRAYLEQARLDLLQSENTRETQKATLKRVLGNADLEFQGLNGKPAMAEPPEPAELTAKSAAWIAMMPEYRRLQAQERAAEAGTTAAWAGFLPSLNITGSSFNSEGRFFPGNNRWSIGATVVIPLFAGGRDYYAVKSAGADWRAAVLARENAFRQAKAQLLDSLARFREAVQKWKVDKTFAEAVMARAKIAREKYHNGLLTFEDWDIIENDLISRQRNLLQSERDRIVAEAGWEQILGKGVFP